MEQAQPLHRLDRRRPHRHRSRGEAHAGGKALKEAGFDFDVLLHLPAQARHPTRSTACSTSSTANWLPVHKAWQLNERHYGALQGLNKADAAAEHGEDQVKIWRRSFDVQPPALEPGDERDPHVQEMFRDVPKEDLPYTRVPQGHHRPRLAVL